MRKLYILVDEWNYNKVFIWEELMILKESYDITIISNDVPDTMMDGIEYKTYSRNSNVAGHLIGMLKFVFDKVAWQEICKAVNTRENIIARLSEIIRFYINAELFYDFMRENSFVSKQSDAIYYSYWNFWKCFALTMHRNRYKDIKIISRIHGYDLYNERLKSGYQPFKKAMENNLDRLVFIAEQGKDYYRDHFLNGVVDDTRCIVSYLGTVNDSELKEYKRSDCFTIVSCSSLIPLKCVDRIINALSMIDDIDIRWVHFGGGVLEKKIKETATNLLNSKNNIKYEIKGHTPNAQVLEYYKSEQVDAFITTSSTEGMPMSIMEAMSYGIPLIAPSVGNIPYMIDGNGILMNNGYTDKDVSEAIRKLADMPLDKYKLLRQRSRDLWEDKYVAEKNFNDFVENVINKL